MKRNALRPMSTDQLVRKFSELAIQQDNAMLERDSRKITRLFHDLMAIVDELKGRPGDQRVALTSLYSHPNMHVRLRAAKSTLAVAPQSARQQLELVKASGQQPQALDAGMALWALDRGDFKPT